MLMLSVRGQSLDDASRDDDGHRQPLQQTATIITNNVAIEPAARVR